MMEWQNIETNWTKVKGQAKQMWGKFNEETLTQLGGKKERITEKLQELYGYTAKKAEEEVKKFQNSIDPKKIH